MGVYFKPSDVHISFLPLAHMFEQYLEALMLYYGGRIGFFGGDILKLVNDIQCLKPTIVAMVPRLLNRIYDAINQKVEESWFPKRKLFQWAMSSKLAKLEDHAQTTHAVWDRVIFGKTKSMLGGNV